MTNVTPAVDEAYLIRRVHEETRAALRADDPKASAAHVELANRYLMELNSAQAAERALPAQA